MAKSDADLFGEGVPDLEMLFAATVRKLMDGEAEAAASLANIFEFFAKTVLRLKGQGVGKGFLEAATITAAEEIKARK